MIARPKATDLCVIGASEAGRAAAMGAAALGLSVILVDHGDPDGMDNPDLLLEILRIEACRIRKLGDGHDDPAIWLGLDRGLKLAAVERRHARLAAMNIRVIRATGHFTDAATVTAGSETIQARRTMIATGGLQRMPGGAGPDRDTVSTVAGLRHLRSAPRRLLVLGTGPDAVAAAQSLRRLGSAVTLIGDDFMPGWDAELTAPLRRQLVRDGVRIVKGAAVDCLEDGPDVVLRLTDGTTLSGSHLLVAESARPAIATLDVARAGIDHRDEALVLTAAGRTTNTRVYAVGRAAGATSATAGVAQAGVALRAAFLHLPGRFKPETVARVSATDPQVAAVGPLAEDPGAGGNVAVWRWPLAQTGAGIAAGSPEGHLKVLTDRGGRILGAGIVGHEIRDLIPFWSLAVQRRLRLADLAEVSLPSPALSEASRALVLSHAAGRLAGPLVRRALRVARWLG